jgi:hypothetical protein
MCQFESSLKRQYIEEPLEMGMGGALLAMISTSDDADPVDESTIDGGWRTSDEGLFISPYDSASFSKIAMAPKLRKLVK